MLKIGMVYPYSLAVPGGVQAHVLGLAQGLRDLGHQVQVLAPVGTANGSKPAPALPEFVTPAGRGVRVPYNGSVVPLAFGPVAANRARRWMHDHDFDLLHLHEPVAPSLSLIALALAEVPVVATFHFATTRSWALAAAQGLLQPTMEKITARIAVSPLARRVHVEYLGGDAVEIPNGVDVAPAISPDSISCILATAGRRTRTATWAPSTTSRQSTRRSACFARATAPSSRRSASIR